MRQIVQELLQLHFPKAVVDQECTMYFFVLRQQITHEVNLRLGAKAVTKHKPPTIIDVIRNRQLFGSLPAFRDPSTWASWLVWLKAVFAFADERR